MTVATTCTIDLGFNTCTGTPTFDSAIQVFEDCADFPNPTWEDTNTCPTNDDALLEIDNLSPQGTKTYYILLLPEDTITGGGEAYAIQGEVVTSACVGDPHFYRWNHQKRDSFHGECDLVLMHKEDIVEGADLDVHIRTTIKDSYSYIESAAMKVGDDAIEFQRKGIYINGNLIGDEELPLTVGESEIVKDLFSEKPKYNVLVANKAAVEVVYTKQFMGVKVAGSDLHGSRGMLGDRKTGDMVARDGRILEDFENFSFEWQVSPEDPQIFMKAREPQLPYERCRMPSVSAESRRRKLRGQDRQLYEKALSACTANHIAENVDSCIDDVMFTGELELADII